MTQPDTPLPPPLAAAIASYLQARDALAVGTQPAALLPGQIIAFACGQPMRNADEIARRLGEDLHARRLYRQVLASRRLAHSPLQACAQSAGAVTRRDGDHFTLYFRTSRAASEQVYVTLEVHGSLPLAEGSVIDVHAVGETQVLSVRFPPLAGRRTQRLFQQDDAVLSLLQDDAAELEVVQP